MPFQLFEPAMALAGKKVFMLCETRPPKYWRACPPILMAGKLEGH